MDTYEIKALPRGYTLLLASASPRRRELLGEMGLPFTVQVSEADEDLPEGIAPRDAVLLLACRKAEAVTRTLTLPHTVVLAADTLVALDGRALGKPADKEEACAMLRALSGRVHHVYTGVALTLDGHAVQDVCETAVRFRRLSEEEIRTYVETGEPMDKAGAYGIQGLGGRLVDGIEGEYDNVVGLPRLMTDRLLARLLAEASAR